MTIHQAIQVAPGSELRYAEKFGSKAFVPTRKVVWYNAGKRYEEDYAAASGYVFLTDTDLADPYLWHYAAGIKGYRRSVGLVRQKDLDIFAARVAEREPAAKQFVPKIGQRVLITSGLFAGQTGKCIWANKKFSKIFIEGGCNSVASYLTIETHSCAPAKEGVKQHKEQELRGRPAKGFFRKHRSKRRY